MTRQEILEALGTTPDRFQSLACGLTTDQLTRRPKEGAWSIAEILNHLLVGERDVIRPRLQRMLLEEAPRFPSSATSRTGFAAEPAPQGFRADLAAFRLVRNQTVELLRRLSEHDWQRIGTTPTRGTLTIEDYVNYLANHDREHLEQLQTIRSAVAH